MTDERDRPDRDAGDPSSPENNPLGLGARESESSNTGSIADTSYNARGSDPYTTGEPRKDPSARSRDADTNRPAELEVPRPDEPGADER